jgi:hypothetical protein
MKPNRTKPIIGIVMGAVLILASVIVGRWQYELGMQAGIDTISSGIADSRRLSGNIDTAIYAAVGGRIGAIVGLIIFIVSVVRFVRAGRQTVADHVTST